MLTSRRGFQVKIRREIGNDQNAEGFRNLAGLYVVFLDRFELTAQILLNHVLHVRGQIGKAFFDLLLFRPDAGADQRFVEIGQVHEARKIIAQTDRIDHRKLYLSRGHGREKPQHYRLHRLHGNGPTLVASLQDEGSAIGEREKRRQLHASRDRRLQILVVGQAAG